MCDGFLEFVAADAYGLVVRAVCGLDQCGGHARAGERAVDQESPLPGALESPFLDLVVEARR
ncbi:hypothetical protein AC230_07400 [Streptomyces caatingaensis]|uniref:Uncharacterized protein n=1 Tax=Streptomyces caatingaensis TaxID=1678637 RepID=A0A0K9XJL4_9ACTN|nr:hypothetical protein AC230_07400 [Streptomyces caatingaensis]